MKKFLKKASDFYGLAHAVSCPTHGLVKLAIVANLSILPPVAINTLRIPHELAEEHIFHPPVEYVMKLRGTYDEERAEETSHSLTDASGWAAFAGFLGYGLYGYVKRKRNKEPE